ncbi:hypothetical protein Dsui_0215 [Azospira oryzae PS]|uniref:Uncharacterized protein n=1 Tax=Azospira oryzae (strain ATCC BAA-33 / DSM 13638 / PS) TaxID=640081 RepID=G8QMQ5_AZOOP|nr:hypothetical protein [Azospira oryzae]AEV24635.1 hypothetical protein Dsui_0215 [Azospira oryzae PS]
MLQMLSNLIPAPYRWIAWGVAAVIIAAGGAWSGHKATAAYYKPKVAKAEARAAEFESAYNSLALASQHQNEAINQMQADANAREKRAAQDVAQARAAAATSRDQATAIMGLKLPAGADECQEARKAFDEELRQERGKR